MPRDWSSAYADLHARGEAIFPPACLRFILEVVRKASLRTDSPDGSLTPAQIVTSFRNSARLAFGALLPEVLRDWGLRSPADLGDAVLSLGRAGLLTLSPDDTREAFAEDARPLDEAGDERPDDGPHTGREA